MLSRCVPSTLITGSSVSLPIIFILQILFEGRAEAGQVDEHLEQGKRLLAAGKLQDALDQYSSAIDLDPKNYLSYFKRATIYMAMGKNKQALSDMDTALEVNGNFLQARLQRANIHLKQGMIESALTDFQHVLEKEPGNSEAGKQELQQLMRTIQVQSKSGNPVAALSSLESAIEIAPSSIDLRELRVSISETVGDIKTAISDLRHLTRLIPDYTTGLLKLSRLLYQNGDMDQSLESIRECLKLDQDHKECKSHYKKVKDVVKHFKNAAEHLENNRYVQALKSANDALKAESSSQRFVINTKTIICTAQSKNNNPSAAIKVCTEVIDQGGSSMDTLCDRGDAYLHEEMFSEAIADFRRALEIDNSFSRARSSLEKAERLQKQSQRRDYYKILGVKRSASKSEINRAYRNLAMQWHPDKFTDPTDKKKAEKTFMDLAAAKEVLTDPEKRAKFDNGEDPLDPEAQAKQGPWHHGGDPFPFGGFPGGSFHFRWG